MGFVAVADEGLPLDVTYVDAVRLPPRVLSKGMICGALLAQHLPTVKTASQIALTWKWKSGIYVWYKDIVCRFKICQLRALTKEIEAGSAEWAGGRVHAVGPLCVRPHPRCLAVVGRIARLLTDFCGVVYRDVLRQRESVLIGTYILGSRRLPLDAHFGSRVGSVLHCRMTREVGSTTVINKETWSSFNKFIA